MTTLVKSKLKTFLADTSSKEDGKLLQEGRKRYPPRLLFPKIAYLFMSQHIGAPAKPNVKKGIWYKRASIGEAQGFVSANVHASVSGKVVDVLP